MSAADPLLSAEVVLAPQSGRSLETAAITAANVHEFAPPREALDRARSHFAEAGFTVGPPGPIGFAIAAPRSVFERVFSAKIATGADGAKVKGRKGAASRELPLGRLPAALGRTIKSISFARALDFGPTGGY